MFAIDTTPRRAAAALASVLGTLALGIVATGTAVAAAPAPVTEFSQGLSGTPTSLTDGPDGNLWFIDGAAIGRITPAGAITEFSAGLSTGSQPHAIIAGPNGNLWFTDVGTTHAIGEITPSGQITEFDAGSSGLNAGATPYDLTEGPNGSVWFTDTGMPRAIGEISANGTITEYTYSNDVNDTLNAITEGPDGNLYVAVQGNNPTVAVVNASTGTITKLPVAAIPGYPNDITAGPDGNVWFDGNASVSRLTVAGDAITNFGTSAGMQAGAAPDAMTAGPDGNVWFIDQYSGHDAVGRVTPTGSVTEFPISGTPWDITTGIDGNLWVPTGTPTAVDRVTPSGTVTAIQNGFDAGANIADGTNITVGPDGNLWTIDEGSPAAIVRVAVQLAPAVTTGAASAVTSAAGTVGGTVNPRGNAASVTIDYGLTSALGNTLTLSSLAASNVSTAVAGTLAGFPPATTVYYRVSATNAYGTTNGATQSFTTAGTTPTPPVVSPTIVRRRTIALGDRRFTLTLRAPGSACVASTSHLSVSLTSARRHGVAVRLRSASLYLDGGIRHVRHVRLHGHRHTIVTHRPNVMLHRLPAHRVMEVARLRSGSHTLRATVVTTRTVRRYGHRVIVQLIGTARIPFRRC